MPASLLNLSNEIAEFVEKSGEAVVAVHARPRFHSSGVHWAPGLIVTAQHALHKDDDILVTRGNEKFSADFVGSDPGTDLAVLRIQSDASIPILTRAEGALRPGMLVAAIGRNTESLNAELGVVSSIGGPSHTRRGGKLDAVVRLDLALHPVSAGGAVVDAAGELIGIATPALSRVAVFVVPNSTVDRVVRSITEHGSVPQGYLGAGLQPIPLPEHLVKKLSLKHSAGLMTISVDANAAAGKAGLLIGDVLLAWNGTPLTSPEALRPLLADAVGKSAELQILRGGEAMKLQVTVEPRARKRE